MDILNQHNARRRHTVTLSVASPASPPRIPSPNYLTHFDPKLENSKNSGIKLSNLCNKLEVLFEVQLLMRLGFTANEIQSLTANSDHVKRKLNPY